MDKVILEPLCKQNQGELGTVYKEVFRGSPWYEDRICSGAQRPPSDPERCALLYTSNTVPNSVSGVIGSVDFTQTKLCISCKRPLIEFYPDYVNQNELIREAQQLRGFYGLLAKISDHVTGFAWGYALPQTATRSVDFPRALPLLALQCIDSQTAFYWAEVGVVEIYRERGIGNMIAHELLSSAWQTGYNWLTLRTKNPAVEKILRRLFPEENITPRFNDSVRGTPWYALDFTKIRVAPLSEKV